MEMKSEMISCEEYEQDRKTKLSYFEEVLLAANAENI